MKKTSFPLLVTTIIIFGSAFLKAPKPKFSPELDKFYTGLNSASVNAEHAVALNNLKSYILRGIGSDNKIDIVISDADNSFTSVSAQIVLQSLLSVNKYNKLIVHSCGYKSGEIDPMLIKVLAKHGYVVSEAPNAANRKKAYEIKFGENMSSLIVYSKQVNEESLPTSNLFQLKTCAADDNTCADLNTAFFKEKLSFATLGANISEDEADKLFTTIATEILNAFNKAKSNI